jgi:hypothetical protein
MGVHRAAEHPLFMTPSPYILPIELIYRSLAAPKPHEPKPASVEAPAGKLTRANVDQIIHRERSATPEELQEILSTKDLRLSESEVNQISVDLTIAMSQRARLANPPRESPGAYFISHTLNLLSTPYGLIDRAWFESLLRSNVEAIAQCRTHRPPRCECWRGAREMLWHAAHTHGDDSPEAWTALQVWTILEELEISSRPER